MTRSQLLPEIFKLDENDQIMIAEAIRNHLAGDRAPLSVEEFNAELERRVAEADANPADESTLEEVVARLRAKR